MANTYRATLVGTEVLDDGATKARVTTVGAEVAQVSDQATRARASLIATQVQQVDANATKVRTTLLGVEVLRTISDGAPQVTHFAAAAFGAALSLEMEPLRRIGGLLIVFAPALSIEFANEPFPRFRCPEPQPKAWARLREPAKGWLCVAIPAPEPCTADSAANDDDLQLASGDRLVTREGLGLKLVDQE